MLNYLNLLHSKKEAKTIILLILKNSDRTQRKKPKFKKKMNKKLKNKRNKKMKNERNKKMKTNIKNERNKKMN